MGKGNGGTRSSRSSSPRGLSNNAQSENYPAWMSDSGWKKVVDELAGGSYPRGWDEIDDDHRELALMEAGFNGLANDGAEDIIFEESKDSILNYVTDELLNYWDGSSSNNFEDMSITVGYTDGRTLSDGEIEPVRKVTANQSFQTQKNILKQTVTGRNVSFVLVQGSWGSNYYAAKGNDHIKEYTGYEKWTNGRGEKKRDYIQDDWI